MAADEVLKALESALAADPSQQAVRVHLAQLYFDAGDWQPALDHAATVLVTAPTDLAALGIAGRAAENLGLLDRSRQYRIVFDALSGAAPPAAAEPPAPSPAPAIPITAGEALNPALDAFLEDVLAPAGADIETPTVTLDDVGGLEDVKRQLRTSFLGPMRNPELRRMYGKSLRGGLLLYGPPGCGKTFLARAVAGELGARFFGVGLHDILDMYVGQSERHVHELFETARRMAPSVVFIDEVDALGMKRTNLARSATRNVVVQLLQELDGIGSDNEGVFVLGATNQPWDLDAALRRPGRFDRTVLVLPPDSDARAAILRLNLTDRPVGPDVDPARIAEKTDGFSGADLRLLCEAAAELALDDSLTTGQARPISGADFAASLRQVKPTTGAWFNLAKNVARFANQDGAYDDLATYLRRNRML